MDGVLFQDWLTIRAASRHVIVTQDASSWLDLSPFIDVVFWTDIANVTDGGGSVRLDYQSSACAESSDFVSILPSPLTLTTPGLITPPTKVLLNSASIPLRSLLRWQLLNPATNDPWDVTFRVWLAVSRSSPTFYPKLNDVPNSLAEREQRGARASSTPSRAVTNGFAQSASRAVPQRRKDESR